MFQEVNLNKNLLLTSSLYIKQKEYWVNKLSGALTDTRLLSDHIKQCRYTPLTPPGNRGEKAEIYIPADLFSALMKLSKNIDLSFYLILLATLESLIYHYTGSEDIIVISPLYKINISRNTLNRYLFIRQQDIGQLTFKELLFDLRQSIFEAYENQDYPFDNLLDSLCNSGQIQDKDFHPNIECLFQNIHDYDERDYEEIKDRLVFSFLREDSRIRGYILYNPAVYDKFYLEQVARHFVRIMKCVLENVNVNIPDIFFLSPEERQRLIYEFNETGTEYTKDKLLCQRFEEQVKRTPGHTALVFEDLHLSYSHLNRNADYTADLLRAKGVKPESIVGIMAERSAEVVVGIWGILKAGGAYLPIDPDYPEERINYMLKDSDAKILLAASAVQGKIEVIDLHPPAASQPPLSRGDSLSEISPTNPAYIIYTSGSTGKPKGVLIEQRNVINLIDWFEETFLSGTITHVLQLTNFNFDVSVEDIFGTLLHGDALHVAGEDIITDRTLFKQYVTKKQIHLLNFIPTFLKELFKDSDDGGRLESLRLIISGGEPLDEPLKDLLIEKGYRLYNNYGPSELTTDALSGECSSPGPVTLGKPIANCRVYILSKKNRLLPIGVAGELCISGSGLCRGYLNSPELTSEKFSQHPFIKGERIYRSGDLAMRLPDGNIVFLGRIDHQVKIRGNRIELEEIERRLLAHKEIEEAVVISNVEGFTGREGKQPGDHYIFAYIVSEKELSVSELREYLSQNLPDYMIPSYFVSLERIPLTSNGKIDRRALPPPRIKTGDNYAPPRNETEEKMVRVWAEVLELDTDVIGIDANFFELGGHSLKATILAAKIQKAFDIRLPLAQVFKMPTIRKLAGSIKDDAVEEKYAGIEPVEQKEFYPLSSAQTRIYVIQQMELESIVYNMPLVLELEGEVEVEKLERISRQLINRYESLRTSFVAVEDEPVQRVYDGPDFEIEYYDLHTGTTGEKQRRIEIMIKKTMKEFIRPFDLFHVPLLRVGLIKKEKQKHILMVDMHHIISDGISLDILAKEFFALYKGEKLPPLRIQYKDFSEWQNSEKEREKLKRQGAFWLKEFEGEIPVLDLPIDYVRPAVRNFEGNTVDFEIGRNETTLLKNMALKENATPYMVLLGLYNILLAKLSGQEDIVIGTPIAGRRHADLQQIIGMFVNMLALRNFPNREKTVTEFLGEVKNRTLNAFENQDYPFGDLVEQAAVRKDMSRNPLFDVTFVFDTIDIHTDKDSNDRAAGNTAGPKRTLQPSPRFDYARQLTKFDLIFAGRETEAKLVLSLQYCTKLFKKETIDRFIDYFKKIVSLVGKEPDIKLSRIDILSEREKKQLLFDFNNTRTAYPQDKTIHQLFEEQAARTPGKIAVVGSWQLAVGKKENVRLSYNELNKRSDQLAHPLREKGVQPDNIVGLMMERSLEMIIGMLGILKAGGAYLPIDPDLPQERIDYMLKDSGAKILLTTESTHSISSVSSVSSVASVASSNLAYVIYTSGSTGRPKGVLIRHQGVVNMVWFHRKVFKENPGSRISQAASAVFDAMAFEVWPCLLSGACLCIIDNETRMHPVRLKEWLIRYQITISFQSTMMARELLEEPWPETRTALEVLRTAGDRLNHHPTRFYPFRFYNLYGPTEDTVWTTWTEVPVIRSLERIPPPSIGKPVGNKQVYILSSDLKLQPLGVSGELCTAGDGLARGYLNNPELTAERFLPGNYRSYRAYRTYIPEKLYRTGDLCRWLPDGDIEFLGRIDHQVKLRGFRIELGEIETQLVKHPRVREAIVLSNEMKGEDKYLCAYITANDKNEVDNEKMKGELNEYLSRNLPDYMIPSYFVLIDRMPLTPAGKIDRKALPLPDVKGEGEYIGPGNELEEDLVEIWSDVLGIDKNIIGIDANFFILGGHSLKATVMTAKINKKFNVNIPLVELFKTPTVRALAEYINCADMETPVKISDDNLILLKPGKNSTNHLFMVHDGTGEVEGYMEFCKRLSDEFNCWGIRAARLDGFAPQKWSIRDISQTYTEKMKKIQPHGPYYILGWSLGGIIAFEMARQMEQVNEETGFLALIDPPPPPGEPGKSPVEFGFNLESELNYVKDYLVGSEIREKLKNAADLSRFWLSIVEYLETNNYDVEMIKKAIMEFGMQALPNYNRLDTRESIYYLNVGRTFLHARERYTIPGKIHTPVHYLAASESGASIDREKWNRYTETPVKTYEVTGDHFSIFKMPHVQEFSELFDRILKSKYNRP